MLKVLFATSEVHPLATTGGLGDVSASLPVALRAGDCDCRLIIPAYTGIRSRLAGIRSLGQLPLPGWAGTAEILQGVLPDGLPCYAFDVPELFQRAGALYSAPEGGDWPDNPYRFGLFARAATLLAEGRADPAWRPDVVHCHDWQTGLIPALLHDQAQQPATVFTIHNLAYLGLCDAATFHKLQLPATLWHPDGIEFFGGCALIKGGIRYADAITTVSPSYATEIQTPERGHGLDGLLRARTHALTGILNGIDYTKWNPAADPFLAQPFDAARITLKRHNKHALQRELGLARNAEAFLLGTVSRLTDQKGVDLIIDAIASLPALPLQFALLGAGDQALQNRLLALAAADPDRVAVRIGYDERLAHRIIAGIDALLMPSRFEPCGLSQLYSQHYGTPPIARRTGGLADSVTDAGSGIPAADATGFLFDAPSAQALADGIRHAFRCYRDPNAWQALQLAGMTRDFSWSHSAAAYRDIYARALAARGAA